MSDDPITLSAVAERMIRIGGRLRQATNETLHRKDQCLSDLVVASLGMSAWRGLRAMRILGGGGLDDQVAALARRIVETALDMSYLCKDTVRRIDDNGNERKIPLSVDDKAELFVTHQFISDANQRESGEIVSSKEGLRQARELRTRLYLSSRCTYWHCTTPVQLFKEMKDSLSSSDQATVPVLHSRWEYHHLSTIVHPGPWALQSLVQSGMPKQRELGTAFHDPMAMVMGIMGGIDAFEAWRLKIRLPMEQELQGVVSDLDILVARLDKRREGP